jgi:hypothetical protein
MGQGKASSRLNAESGWQAFSFLTGYPAPAKVKFIETDVGVNPV